MKGISRDHFDLVYNEAITARHQQGDIRGRIDDRTDWVAVKYARPEFWTLLSRAIGQCPKDEKYKLPTMKWLRDQAAYVKRHNRKEANRNKGLFRRHR